MNQKSATKVVLHILLVQGQIDIYIWIYFLFHLSSLISPYIISLFIDVTSISPNEFFTQFPYTQILKILRHKNDMGGRKRFVSVAKNYLKIQNPSKNCVLRQFIFTSSSQSAWTFPHQNMVETTPLTPISDRFVPNSQAFIDLY